MIKVDFFAIGASAGGLEALQLIARHLPPDFPAAIGVVVHVGADSPGLIPAILTEAGPVPAAHARDGEPAVPGRIYVAPPDRHLIVDRDHRLRLGSGPKENRFRPAIDPLFRSVALAYDGHAAGVILSGGLDDGVAGLVAIKSSGGVAIVQDPEEALVPSLPAHALAATPVDHCLPVREIGAAMLRYALGRGKMPTITEEAAMSDLEKHVLLALGEEPRLPDLTRLGEPTLYTCPECHGGMVHVRDSVPPSFRCHMGHAFTLRTLIQATNDEVERALLRSLRTLEQCAALHDELSCLKRGDGRMTETEREQLIGAARGVRRRATIVRQALKR